MSTTFPASIRPAGHVLGVAICTLLLAACSKDGKTSSAHGGSQVVARVNGDEISVLQVNDAVSRLGAQQQAGSNSADIRRKVLDGLVDQQIAVQQAIDRKLDRSPEVLTAIEAARRQILARAFLGQEAQAIAKPSDEEARKYYAEHPELFSDRKLYRLQEVVIPGASSVPAEKIAEFEHAQSLEQIIAWLKSQNIKYTTSRADRAAEQIPFGLIKQIGQLKEGQMITLKGPQSISILQLVTSKAAPVTEAEALPKIQQFLANQRSTESVEADLKSLRAKAKLEYLGEFATAGAAAPATPATASGSARPQATAAAPAAPPAVAAAPSTGAGAASATAMDKTNLDKGVAGLR